jgi:5-methylcytosine-specific restriction enzyme subunit McrC
LRLTVFEQSSLPVRNAARLKDGVIATSHAVALVNLSERMGALVVSWDGPAQVRVHHFVGVLQAGDLELEILPKLEGLPDPALVRHSLLAMLAQTQGVRLEISELVRYLESSEPFIAAIARLYVQRLLDAVRRGLRQDYVLHEELLPCIRGKVHWGLQARLQASLRLEFACLFDDRSLDTPLNRVLKAALLRASRILDDPASARLVSEARHALADVSNECPPLDRVVRLQTDRMSRNLEPVLALAKVILGNKNPDFGRSVFAERRSFAVVWDMNVLFEEYVGRRARAVMASLDVDVRLQQAGVYLAREAVEQKKAFLLRPDLLFAKRRGHYIAVGDTKWKRLSRSKSNLGVSQGDVYQLLAYARRFKVDLAVLLYPHHPALGPPGTLREFEIDEPQGQPTRLRICTVDLARLEDVPEQLKAAFAQIPLTRTA